MELIMAEEKLIDKIKSIHKEISLCLTTIKSIKKDQKDISNNIIKIEKNYKKISNFSITSQDIEALNELLTKWKDELNRELASYKDNINKTFLKNLNSLLEAKKIKLKKWSSGFSAGLYLLELSEIKQKVTIWYGPKIYKIDEVSMDHTTVYETILDIENNLGSRLPENDFKNKLSLAYDRAKLKTTGKYITFVKVISELSFVLQSDKFYKDPKKEYYKNYLFQDLSFDLYRLKKAKALDNIELKTATRANTKAKTDSIWIPNSEDIDSGAHYSEIYIKEIK